MKSPKFFRGSSRDDIELTVEIPEGVWPMMVHRSELDLVLLSNGINMRDAMPNGGLLRIEARNVSFSPSITVADETLFGDFVPLTLADTRPEWPCRCGRAHLSLLTTKEAGQGSGLGLSQVHGIFVKQSGGAASTDTAAIGEVVERTSRLRCTANLPPADPHRSLGYRIERPSWSVGPGQSNPNRLGGSDAVGRRGRARTGFPSSASMALNELGPIPCYGLVKGAQGNRQPTPRRC